MTKAADVIVALIAAAGGELTGRVRLQKSVYLLKRLGLEVPFEFEYYHYGPYSKDVDAALLAAKSNHRLEEKQKARALDGAPFSVFSLNGDFKKLEFPGISLDEAEKLIKLFAVTNATILELAATADWLRDVEHVADWRSELKRRKGAKTENGRLERAAEFLDSIGLMAA